jgi:uncharacterized protein YbbC (DUF1343 family)
MNQYSSSVFVLGSDVLFDRQLLRGRTIGLVCNPASIDGQFRHVIDRAEAGGVTIGALFGPQHGFRSDVQENMIESTHATDARRKIRVYSLYSETREPTPEMLAGLDALVIDLQDVGTRIYTYIYTMANCMRAARRHDLPVVVCDRPNPIGGVAVEGPMLEPGYESFVGQYPIPMRHGMTLGELARLFNDAFGIGAKLEVVKMPAWARGSYGDELGLPWVLPSPNIPTVESCIVYPGTVLLEGTNISEGRGTTRTVRTGRRAVGGCRVDRRRAEWAGIAGRPFPSGAVRAHLPQARQGVLRRLSDSRDGSLDVPRRGNRRGRDRGVREGRPWQLRVASASLRVRIHEAADRHPVRIRRAARRPGPRGLCSGARRRLGRRRGAVPSTA